MKCVFGSYVKVVKGFHKGVEGVTIDQQFSTMDRELVLVRTNLKGLKMGDVDFWIDPANLEPLEI